MLNRTKWLAVFANCDGRVKYGLDKKFVPISIDTSEVDECDCSGLNQKMFWAGTGIVIPAGSVTQHDWFVQHGYREVPLAEAIVDDTNQVYVFFKVPGANNDPFGHTGFFFNRRALQSYGGHGVGSTDCQTVIDWGVSVCYLIPSEA